MAKITNTKRVRNVVAQIDRVMGNPRIPTCMDDIPWPADFRRRLSAIIERPDNILIVGPPGTCKTSTARFAAKAMDADVTWVNANEKGGDIDVKKIIADVSLPSLSGKPKIVVIDEADSCPPAILNLLRGEGMDSGTPIWLIANDPKRFSEAVRSRCETFIFDETVDAEVQAQQFTRGEAFVKACGIEMAKEDIEAILSAYTPDFRRGLRALDTAVRDVRAGRQVTLPDADDRLDDDETPLPRNLSKKALQIETAQLLRELIAIFERHLVLRPGSALVLALFVMHAYAHDAANISPILAVLAPDRDCGKTAVIMLLWCLIENAEQLIQPTGPTLFKRVDAGVACLMDECDEYLTKGSSDLMTVLNSGFTRGAGSVARYNSSFKCWGIKAIGQIGPIAKHTLASRCLAIEMDRKQEGEIREEVTEFLRDGFADIRLRGSSWALAAHATLRASKPIIANASNRLADKQRALIAIADLAGKDFGKDARAAMARLEAARPVQVSIGTELLAEIKQAFASRGGDVLFSEDLVAYLHSLPDKDWARRLGPYPEAEIARILSQYLSSDHRDGGGFIKPKRQSETGGDRLRGYHRRQFDKVFKVYAPDPKPLQATKPVQKKTGKPVKKTKLASKKAKSRK